MGPLLLLWVALPVFAAADGDPVPCDVPPERALVVAAPAAVTPGVSEKRVALVIGNSDFAKLGILKNPVNDAADMAARLRSLHFEVIECHNLNHGQIGPTLALFRSKLQNAAVGLVFVAGHGVQISGENYFPGVDARIDSKDDVPNQSLALRQLLDLLGDSKTRLNLLFLDACRDNPFVASTRSAVRGLAAVGVNAPSGTLISYATRPGSVASDGAGRNGLYTSQLLAQMTTAPYLPIEFVIKRVIVGVKQGSKGTQEPWYEGSIDGDFCFAQCAETALPPTVEGAVGAAAVGAAGPPARPPAVVAAAAMPPHARAPSAAVRLATATARPPPFTTDKLLSQAVAVSVPNLEPLYFTRAISRTEPGRIFRLDAEHTAPLHTRTTKGNGGIYSIAVSPRGEFFFCDATEARIFKLDGEREIIVYQHETPIKHLAFDPAGRLFFSSVLAPRGDDGIYELVDGKAVPYYKVKPDDLGGSWSGTFAFDPEGRLWLSSGAMRPAALYRVREQRLEKIYDSEQTGIMGFTFLSDGSIAFADNDHSVMRLTVPTLQLTTLFESPYDGHLTDVKGAQAGR